MIVLRPAALTRLAGAGLAVAITGGHVAAQSPEQLDAWSLSPTHRYNARPDAPVRYLPRGPRAVPISTRLEDAPEPVAVDERAPGREPLPHAFTSSTRAVAMARPAAPDRA